MTMAGRTGEVLGMQSLLRAGNPELASEVLREARAGVSEVYGRRKAATVYLESVLAQEDLTLEVVVAALERAEMHGVLEEHPVSRQAYQVIEQLQQRVNSDTACVSVEVTAGEPIDRGE